MIRSDPVQELRDVYEMWSQFKQSVVDWFQTNGWLIELGIIGFVAVFLLMVIGFCIYLKLAECLGRSATTEKELEDASQNVAIFLFAALIAIAFIARFLWLGPPRIP